MSTTPMIRPCVATLGGQHCTLDFGHAGDHTRVRHMPGGFPYTVAFWSDGAVVPVVIKCTLYGCYKSIGHDGPHDAS